jgi:hypothetical protein
VNISRSALGDDPSSPSRSQVFRKSSDCDCLCRQWLPQQGRKFRWNYFGSALKWRMHLKNSLAQFRAVMAQVGIDVGRLHGKASG